MINITFPDGSVRQYEKGTTGLQIAESISSRLAQDVIAVGVNDQTTEINRPITTDASIKLYKWDDAEGKHAFWHTSAHLMAEALQELYPHVKFGIGPAIENGFYYDIDTADMVIRENDFPKHFCAYGGVLIGFVCGGKAGSGRRTHVCVYAGRACLTSRYRRGECLRNLAVWGNHSGDRKSGNGVNGSKSNYRIFVVVHFKCRQRVA